MSVFDNARLVIYRMNRKGLEVFLLKPEVSEEEKWRIPETMLKYRKSIETDDYIELEPCENENGDMQKVVAIEADWHQIPSVRAIIKEDVQLIKDKIKKNLPLEEGKYVMAKEAIKKVLPKEYKVIKELKDVLFDRNQSKYI